MSNSKPVLGLFHYWFLSSPRSSCPKGVNTYNSHYPNAEKTLSQGGYSTAVRAHERFVFPIPSGLALEEAAPMLCAGLTVYSPLVRNGAGYVDTFFLPSFFVDKKQLGREKMSELSALEA
jgi:hypothetical protein